MEKWRTRLVVLALVFFAVGLPVVGVGTVIRYQAFQAFKPDPSIKIRTMGDKDALVPHNVAEQVGAGILLVGAFLLAASCITFPIEDAIEDRARRARTASRGYGAGTA